MAVLDGFGTLLEYSLDGTAYVAVGQRVSINGPGRTVESIETTNLDSTARTFRPNALPDNGEVSCTVQFDPDDSSHTAIEGMLDSPVAHSWRITFTDDTPAKYTMEAFPTAFNIGPYEGGANLEAELTLKVSGGIAKS